MSAGGGSTRSKETALSELLDRMPHPPRRPTVYFDVLIAAGFGDENAAQRHIVQHAWLCRRLFEESNVTFAAVNHELAHIPEIISLFGLPATAALVLGIELHGNSEQPNLTADIAHEWAHARSTAESARRIAELAGCDSREAIEAYTAGLLHDFGRVILRRNFPRECQQSPALAGSESADTLSQERETFGITHPELGAHFFAEWGLSPDVVLAVGRHHDAPDDLPRQFSALIAVHLAERLMAEGGFPESLRPRNMGYPPALRVDERLNLFRTAIAGTGRQPGEAGRKLQITAAPQETPPPADATASGARFELKGANKERVEKHSPKAPVRRGRLAAAILLFFGAVLMLIPGSRERISRLWQKSRPQSETIQFPAPAMQPTAFQGLQLQGILYSARKSSAIINGKSLTVGDEIEGARVLSITPDEVVLGRSNQQASLRIP